MAQLINKLDSPWKYLVWAVIIIAILLIAWLLTRVNARVFRAVTKNKRKSLHINFLEKAISAVIVISFAALAISAISGLNSLWQALLGGTAVFSAVAAFVAQDVIKDILAGIMISIHKPFEIGDRIVLENGTAGIVEEVTLRHVVLRGVDTLRTVIPNSKINSEYLTNYSYHRQDRSVQFRFSVSYDTDMQLAKNVVFEAVRKSPYSIPVRSGKKELYTPPYFFSFADSALILVITVYFERKYDPEQVIDDINTRVREALLAAGIEIPYNYVNVIEKK